MLEAIHLKEFTVFKDQRLEFSDGITLLVGENGTGKSHLLKLAYSIAVVGHEADRDPSLRNKDAYQRRLAQKLVGVFRPEGSAVGRLVRRTQGRNSSRVELRIGGLKGGAVKFGFSTKSRSEVALEFLPEAEVPSRPIFLPSKEVLSMFPGFAALYRNREIAIDETYYDLCLALDLPPLRGARLETIRRPLESLESSMGGTLERQGDQFFVRQNRGGKVEMPLAAEGVRKLATLAQLLRSGTLTRNGILFWDEPESNLNPRLLRVVAQVLAGLASQGIQIIVATHSYFLIKEFELIRRETARDASSLSTRFATLKLAEPNLEDPEAPFEAVIESGPRLRDISDIAALEEELAQYDREQEIAVSSHG